MLGRIGFIAVAWGLASTLLIEPSERFYAVIPVLFGSESIWKLLEGRRRAAKRRSALTAGVAALLLAILAWDNRWPSSELQPYERSVIAYAVVSGGLVIMVLWSLVSGTVRRITVRCGLHPPEVEAQTRESADSAFPSTRTGQLPVPVRRLLERLVSILLFALILNAYLMAFMETHWPKRLDAMSPSQVRLAYEEVSWRSRDGTRIAGWYVPAADSERTAVVCHGVAAYKSDMMDFILALHEGGFNVLALDFRGHGQSGGHTVTYGSEERWDIITGIDMLRERFEPGSRRVVGVGWSMGAASLILAAAEDPRIEALHVDAAYARTFDIARVIAAPFPPVFEGCGLYLGTALACLESGADLFRLAPVEHVGAIAPRPILFVHGGEDKVIPIEQGRKLLQAAREPKQWHVAPGAGHCATLALESPRYEKRMVDFLDQALRANCPGARIAAPDQ